MAKKGKRSFSLFPSDDAQEDVIARLLEKLTQRPGWPEKYAEQVTDEVVDEIFSLCSPAHRGDEWVLIIKPDGDGYRIFDATSEFACRSRVVTSDSLRSPESELPISLLDFAQRGGKLVGHKDPVQAAGGEQLRKIEDTMRGNRPGAEAGMMAIRWLMAEVWPRIQRMAQQEAQRGDWSRVWADSAQGPRVLRQFIGRALLSTYIDRSQGCNQAPGDGRCEVRLKSDGGAAPGKRYMNPAMDVPKIERRALGADVRFQGGGVFPGIPLDDLDDAPIRRYPMKAEPDDVGAV